MAWGVQTVGWVMTGVVVVMVTDAGVAVSWEDAVGSGRTGGVALVRVGIVKP